MGSEHTPQYTDDDPQITRARIAELADVTRPTVTGWEKRYPDFPSPRKAGGAAYFLQSGIVDWLDGRSVPLHLRHPGEDEEATYGRRARAFLARGAAQSSARAASPDPDPNSNPDIAAPHDLSAPRAAEGRNQRLIGELMALADEVRGPGRVENYLQLLLALHFLRTVSGERWSRIRAGAAEASARGGSAGEVLEHIGREVDVEVQRLGILPHFTDSLADLVPRNAGVLVAVMGRVGKLDGDAFQLIIEAYETHGRLRSREFFTPKGVVWLMAALAVDSFDGVPRTAYDPYVRGGECLAEGFALAERLRQDHSDHQPLTAYGRTTVNAAGLLASLNLALHGVRARVRLENRPPWVDSPDTRFDLVLTNPPFNMKDSAGQACRTGTWAYGAPPLDNDNFAYVQHSLASLKEGGRAVMVMPTKAGNSGSPAETAIRRAVVETGAMECAIALPARLFSGTAVPVSLWLLRHPGEPCDQVLFLDARHLGTRKGPRSVLEENEAFALLDAYRAHQGPAAHRRPHDVPAPPVTVPSALLDRRTLLDAGCSLSPVDHVRQPAGRPDERHGAVADASALAWAEVARSRERSAAADERAEPVRGEGIHGGTHEADWRMAELAELCEIKAGPSFSQLGTKDRGPAGIVPVVFPRHLREGRISDTGEERISGELARRLAHFELEAGDIVCVRAGRTGPPALVRPEQAGWLPSANLTRLRVREDASVDPGYLLAWLSRPEVLTWIEDRSAATAASSISTGTLGRLAVRLPPLPEQRRIAGLLARLEEQVLAHRELATAVARARGLLGEELMSPALLA
ncbi:N-6 DNA methylase [Streptomyces sp. NPDC060333]|uniref:N-6 DNA methylase n=1 Tax=Streptomyces sp. NPDC060333 TaxID=3347098 RepID=UPI003665A9BD